MRVRRLGAVVLLLVTLAGCDGTGTTGTVQEGAATTSGAPGTSAGAGSTSATGSAAPAEAQAKDARVGQAIRVQAPSRDATVTLVSLKSYTAGKGDLAQAPTAGAYLVADVLVVVAKGTYNVNPLYFKYQAPDGTTSDTSTGNAAISGYEPALHAGSINAGQRTRGLVVFDAVAGSGAKVQLTDELSAVLGQWAV